MTWFYVAPYAQDRWILLAQDHAQGATYDSEGAAIRVAARAAELSFARDGESAGVKVEHHGRWLTAIAWHGSRLADGAEVIAVGTKATSARHAPAHFPTALRDLNGLAK